MKKQFEYKYTKIWFWISIVIVITNVIGGDPIELLLIGLNPILNMVVNSSTIDFAGFMNSGFEVLNSRVSIYWHIGCVLTYLFYGLIIDAIRYASKTKATGEEII